MTWFVRIHDDEDRHEGPFGGPVIRLGSSSSDDGNVEIPGVGQPWVDLVLTGARWFLIADPNLETTVLRASGEVVTARGRVALEPGDRFATPGSPEVSLEPVFTRAFDEEPTDPGEDPPPGDAYVDAGVVSEVVVEDASESSHVLIYGLPPGPESDEYDDQRAREEADVRRRMNIVDAVLETSDGVRRRLDRLTTQLGVGRSCDVQVTWSGPLPRSDGVLVRVRERFGQLWIEDLSGVLTLDGVRVEWEPVRRGADYRLQSVTLVFS